MNFWLLVAMGVLLWVQVSRIGGAKHAVHLLKCIGRQVVAHDVEGNS